MSGLPQKHFASKFGGEKVVQYDLEKVLQPQKFIQQITLLDRNNLIK